MIKKYDIWKDNNKKKCKECGIIYIGEYCPNCFMLNNKIEDRTGDD